MAEPIRACSSRPARPVAALVAICLCAGFLGLGTASLASAQESSPKGYIEIPASEDGSYVLTAKPGSGHNWGTPDFVRFLVMVAREWKRRHPEGPVLRIGDMSRPDGAEFPPHKTHRDGLTADLFTSPKNVCHVSYPDQGLTEELAQLMYDYGARQILYNGDRVVKAVPVAQKYPKHDDHFHVVIDPSRVPPGGGLMVMPEPGSRSGDWISAAQLNEERSDLILRWRVLGEAKLKSARIQFDDLDPDNGVLHDSGAERLRQPAYKLPLTLEDGGKYRWRVQLELADQAELLETSWQTLSADLRPPEVVGASPGEGELVDQHPELRWRYTKDGVPQRQYWVELDKDPDHKRVWVKLGPFESSSAAATLPAELKLRRSKTYHWRVRVEDAHGNLAESEWVRFKTTSGYGKKREGDEGAEPESDSPVRAKGSVSANSLNMRQGPGTQHAVVTTLSRGQEVSILGEQAGWLEIEVQVEGRSVRGFVSASYIQR